MLRAIVVNKWVLAGIVLLIVLSVGCVFWYRYDTEADRRDAVETDKTVKEWEATQKAEANGKVGYATDVSVESTMPTTETLITDTSYPVRKTATSTNKVTDPDITSKSETEIADVSTSPHGFGPYPKIPEGAPVNPFTGRESKINELLMRVIIEKWNEGERFTGASFHGGRLYLNYPNTVYVQYGEPIENEDGTVTRPITSAGGSNSVFISEYQMRTGQIPSNLRVLEYDKSGIDPYEYLELP